MTESLSYIFFCTILQSQMSRKGASDALLSIVLDSIAPFKWERVQSVGNL